MFGDAAERVADHRAAFAGGQGAGVLGGRSGVDEAARVLEDLYKAVRPMLAVSGGDDVAAEHAGGAAGVLLGRWSAGGREWTAGERESDGVPADPGGFLERSGRRTRSEWYGRSICASSCRSTGV